MTKRVAILFSGSGSNMVALIDSMTGDHPARPVVALCNTPDAPGFAKAEARDVPTELVDHRDFKGDRPAFEGVMTRTLERYAPDIICFAGFMRILTDDFISRWQGRMINIHPSLLPSYRGLDTHARAIAAGEAEAGCTVHEVTLELDDGPILGQARVPVHPGDTPQALAARVLEQEHRLYPAVLRRFAAGDRTPVHLP
ncbi:phosphoribosylglycinamide formyltransferase [Roseovarius atlanticus]|uniref:phosphoribosylglycinamide formyltransferase n=1 Tax=Roseovarius atlanticus TaxID=1641875 RepID=UPI001C95BD8F|nr:phosphoribosylglycinamide formyltransferase [Roseovarius atlanticus]MBY5988957.1 phosphoribosylglycinamide formyltransferase [Roseovarius atlanticus]MBY6124349.1 phosphoribosylglycinamide formyltransferase [Roseovarius atlanticus]MBY6148844.1 phosphoribosylglycinamide formyltransferase [Roseovarius atlanticus]